MCGSLWKVMLQGPAIIIKVNALQKLLVHGPLPLESCNFIDSEENRCYREQLNYSIVFRCKYHLKSLKYQAVNAAACQMLLVIFKPSVREDFLCV